MAASIAAVVIIATVLEPWAILIRLATPNPRNRNTRPEPTPAAAFPTKARSITGPIPVACNATPNAPRAAMIRMLSPASGAFGVALQATGIGPVIERAFVGNAAAAGMGAGLVFLFLGFGVASLIKI